MTYKTSVHLAADLSRLALDIANQPAPVDMINRVAQLAGGLIDRAAADLITITGKGRLRVVASSDPGLERADGDGVAGLAAHHHQPGRCRR